MAEPNSNPEESIYFDAVAIAKTEGNAKPTGCNNYMVNTSTATINNMNIYNNLNLNSINNNINNNNFNINVLANNNNPAGSRNMNAIHQQTNSRNNNGANTSMNVVEMDMMIEPGSKKQPLDVTGSSGEDNPMGYNVRLYEDNLKIQRYKIVNNVSELTSDNAVAPTSNTCECTATANAIVLAPTSIATSTLASGIANPAGNDANKTLDQQANNDVTDAEPYEVAALKLYGAKFNNPNNIESKPNNSLDSSKMMDENTSSSMISDGQRVQQIRYNIGDAAKKELTHFNMAGMAIAGSKIPIFHPTNSRIAKCASWAGVDSTNSSMSSTNPDMADLTPGE